jgi:hypothetical protein
MAIHHVIMMSVALYYVNGLLQRMEKSY